MQLLGEGYWFLQFILLAYVIVYFLLRQLREYLSVMLILSVVATWGGIILSPWTEQSVWHEFHWFCYSSVLILGMICGKKKNIIKSNWWMTLLCFIFYFILMAFGKGKSGGIYYIQLVALIPLLGFVYNLYFWINKWIAIVIERKWLYRPIYWLGSLCLEIYVVQHVIITDRFNCLFPLNVIIVFLLIFGAAYALRIFTNFFNQTLAKESYNWKKMITI